MHVESYAELLLQAMQLHIQGDRSQACNTVLQVYIVQAVQAVYCAPPVGYQWQLTRRLPCLLASSR
jgi:hypothetical protein